MHYYSPWIKEYTEDQGTVAKWEDFSLRPQQDEVGIGVGREWMEREREEEKMM